MGEVLAYQRIELDFELAVVAFYRFGGQAFHYHAGADGDVAQPVDQDKAAGIADLLIRVERHRIGEAQLAQADLVELELACGQLVELVDLDAVADSLHLTATLLGGQLDVVDPARLQGLLPHPDDMGQQVLGHLRTVGGIHQQVAAADVDFIREGDRDGLTRQGVLQIAVEGDDAGHRALFAGRQHSEAVADPQNAGGQSAREAAKIEVGAVHVLHWQAHRVALQLALHLGRLQQGEQGLALIPGQLVALVDHVVTVQRRDRHDMDGIDAELLGELAVVGTDALEHLLTELHQIHLVDRHHELLDAEQARDKAVTTGLIQYPFAGVDQNDGQITGGGAGGHVAGVLLVARGIRDDKFALGGGEIAVGHVDGDALLALRLQAVYQQRQVQLLAGGAKLLAVGLQRFELILINLLGVVQQAADKGALAVIHAAAGEKTQQALVLLGVQIGFDALFGNGGLNIAVHADDSLEISLTLLLLHGAGLIVVNQPPLPLARGGKQHLFNNFRQGGGS